ncbi:hypothetical protein [uncultured Granulicatella sp.]|uniref:hypothetical protein n=1 Tax=uncultured Granulicatella sp. TaxID=316089 RepID=UPI0028D0CE05|nr:hypothetical protein [uncultured Granulicatella sp.]
MKFERKGARPKPNFLKEGKHDVTIISCEMTKSKKGSQMLKLILENNQSGRGYYYLVFGTDYTEDYLQYLLTSVEDHGYDIPEVDFGYNKETVDFLKDKEIYVEIDSDTEGKQKRYFVSRILTLSEYDDSFDDSYEDEDDDFSFPEE